MKKAKTIFTIIIIVASNLMVSQEKKISQAILDDSCECIKKIDFELDKISRNDSIRSCITSSIMADQMKDVISQMAKVDSLKNTNKELSYKIIVDKDLEDIEEILLADCSSLKELLMENNQKHKNSISNNKKAREFYEEGQKYSAKGMYDLAIVEYNKAVKKDSKFAFAWDNLGICYRKLNRYEEAIKCYKKSLELDPKGNMPLMNMGVAYDFLKDYKSASEVYVKYIEYYPEDPEGYYGAGRMFYQVEDYEKALENIFQAYMLYKDTNSPYIHDAENTIVAFYNDMKEKGLLEKFQKIAGKYKIVMN